MKMKEQWMRIFLYVAILVLAIFAARPLMADEALNASRPAAEMDKKLDWHKAGLIEVQDAGRYKTFASFAREALSAMYGAEHFPGLSPEASLLDWLFRRDAYRDAPVIYIRDTGLRIDFTTHMPDDRRDRILRTGYMTFQEFEDPAVQQHIDELEPRNTMASAMRRVRDAQTVAESLDRLLQIVPAPGAAADARWFTPMETVLNLPQELLKSLGAPRDQSGREFTEPVPGLSTQQANSLVLTWSKLRAAWRGGDAAAVQKSLDELADYLPTLAAPGVYPSMTQRSAEITYYKMGKFTFGWMIYLLGAIISVFAVVTRWKFPWIAGQVLLLLGLGCHAVGIALRWYIVGRIPNANMFEAVVFSAWVGVASVIGIEVLRRTIGSIRQKSQSNATRAAQIAAAIVGLPILMIVGLLRRTTVTPIFLLAANVTGFFALLIAGFVIPGGGNITTIMGILDDLMLRIHTVMIISSYALIFAACVIAVAYLFGYYWKKAPARSAEVGFAAAGLGVVMLLGWQWMFVSADANLAGAGGWTRHPGLEQGFLWAAAVVALAYGALWILRSPAHLFAINTLLLATCICLAVLDRQTELVTALIFLIGGLAWAVPNVFAALAGRPRAAQAEPGGATMRLATVGAPIDVLTERPLLAGGAPGDERSTKELPLWLQNIDWCHLIILNLVFILLFVGTILGAVWADYSWGRPWGWDPKEVFALNTWLVYAILIHVRFFVKNKGLWTAWLSVAGCAMMAFNWCFVNFFIVGLHSYA